MDRNGFLIKDITLLNPYHIDKMKKENKLMYTQVDVLVELENGKKVTIELQNHRKEFFQQRSLYYLSKAYVLGYNDIRYQKHEDYEGEDLRYSSLNGAMGLNFLNYTQFKDDNLPLRLYSLNDAQTHVPFVEENHFALYFIELGKHHYASGKLKEWMMLLKNGENISKRLEFLENVYEPVKKLHMSLEEELEAEAREKAWQDHLATKYYYKNEGKREARREAEKWAKEKVEKEVKRTKDSIFQLKTNGLSQEMLLSAFSKDYQEYIESLYK